MLVSPAPRLRLCHHPTNDDVSPNAHPLRRGARILLLTAACVGLVAAGIVVGGGRLHGLATLGQSAPRFGGSGGEHAHAAGWQ